MKKYTAIVAIALCSLIGAVKIVAQKLPGKQIISLRAPETIKVDGKATEWKNQFQAYNIATELFYTLANNGTELYLTVYCTDKGVIRQIMNNGLSLTIHKSGTKNDPAPMVITYPVFDERNKFWTQFEDVIALKPGERPPAPIVEEVRFASPGAGTRREALTKTVSDSLMKVNNSKVEAKAKNIRTSGIKGLDALISVYNDDGIKAAGQFDKKMCYTYELTVSLDKLGLAVNPPTKFMYQIKVNEMAQTRVYITKGGMEEHMDPGPSATDFWAEYTLAKP